MAAELAQVNYVPCGCKAILSEKDPRAPIWRAVLGKLEFPLLNPIHHVGSAEGEYKDFFLKGDWKALSEEEQNKLANEMQKRFGINEKMFFGQIKTLGYVPIKDVNISVLFCQLHTRCML